MVREKLQRVLAFCRCGLTRSHTRRSRGRILKKHIPFPLSHFLPKKMHLKATRPLQESGFQSKGTSTEHSFMKKVPPSLQVTFLEAVPQPQPGGRGELLRDVAKAKAERGHEGDDEETTWYGLPKGQGFRQERAQRDRRSSRGDRALCTRQSPAGDSFL
ncbi:hypothetical protein PINS_up018388 [Pythium insidiosum]|nr:hypothetical protein PINS_up018388 [Pythium insidiosum]